MNRDLFLDAVGLLDPELIEEHLSARIRFAKKRLLKKRLGALKRAIIASCFFVSAISIMILYFSNVKNSSAERIAAISDSGFSLILFGIVLICVIAVAVASWRIGTRIIEKKVETDAFSRVF